jgi:hypothetical protein
MYFNEKITFGGRELRKDGVGFFEDCPAEANSRVAGSLMVVLDHLRGERPPLASTRFDCAAMPFFGFPYLNMKIFLSFFPWHLVLQCPPLNRITLG